MPAASAVEIFRFLLEGMREGHRGLLTTITDLTGTGARAVGTHMAVLDNGDCAGSFSSGCVEAAIIAEAIEVFSGSRPRVVRFGQGSPYIDRSEEHTSELQSLMRISYAVFCLKKKNKNTINPLVTHTNKC